MRSQARCEMLLHSMGDAASGARMDDLSTGCSLPSVRDAKAHGSEELFQDQLRFHETLGDPLYEEWASPFGSGLRAEGLPRISCSAAVVST